MPAMTITPPLRPIPPPPAKWSTPVISSISPASAGPGDTVVINGQNFGAAQGNGYVLFSDNGVNWGQPGDVAEFQLINWSSAQISFRVPVKDTNGYQITPGTTANISVTNGGTLTSNTISLPLHSAVRWPVAINSGVTTIGTTGNGFMQTSVTIDQSGNLNAATDVWDTSQFGPLTGFHGGVVVQIYDTFKNVIGTFPSGPYGVQGGQNNENPWKATLSQAQCDQLAYISVVNFYNPQDSVLNWIESNLSTIASAAKLIAALV